MRILVPEVISSHTSTTYRDPAAEFLYTRMQKRLLFRTLFIRIEMRLSLTFRECQDQGSTWLLASWAQMLALISWQPREAVFLFLSTKSRGLLPEIWFSSDLFFFFHLCLHIIYLNKHKTNAFYSPVFQKTDPAGFLEQVQGFIRLLRVNSLDYSTLPRERRKMHLKIMNTETIQIWTSVSSLL